MKKKLVITVLVCLLLSSCELIGIILFNSTKKIIRYSVSGTASSVKVKYNDSTGYVNSNYITPPWATSCTVTVIENSFFWAEITATNNGASGNVTVSIYVDGDLVTSSSGSGSASAHKGIMYND